MLKLLLLILTFSSLTHAQDDISWRHTRFCEDDPHCRINIILEKENNESGTCRGILFDELECEFSYSAKDSGSKVNVLCVDSLGNKPLDALVSVQSFAYRVFSVTTAPDQMDKVNVDPRLHLVFDHPAMKLWVEKEGGTVNATITMMPEGKETPVTEISCEANSESVPSSDAQPQSGNPS